MFEKDCDKVMENFATINSQLGTDDRARMQAHQSKIESLYNRMVSGTGECNRPSFTTGPTYRYGEDDNITAPIFNDMMVQALSLLTLTRMA